MEADLPQHVQRTLADYLDSRLTECRELEPAFGEAAQRLARFALAGGKRIRPTFAWWGWRAAGGAAEGPEAVAMLRAATALELIQACALAHDDLIDDSDTRRGQPTVHRSFAESHEAEGFAGSSDRFGAAAAILLGDLALVWADDMLRESGVPQEALTRGFRPWRAMRTEVLGGQYIDVLGHARGDEAPRAVLRIDELKSASYTVRHPLLLGAEIGGAGQNLISALSRFGSDIGIAFQLRDDLLGVFGDPAVTGKPAGDDLREGKRTLLIAEGLERAQQQDSPETTDLLRRVLGSPDESERSIERAREALIRIGAVDAVERRITELTDTALTTLDTADIAEPAATRLGELAVAATIRKY